MFCKSINLNFSPIIQKSREEQGTSQTNEELTKLPEKRNYTDEELFKGNYLEKFLNVKRKKNKTITKIIDKRINSIPPNSTNQEQTSALNNVYPHINYIPDSTIRVINNNQPGQDSGEIKDILPGSMPGMNEPEISHTSEREEEIDRMIMQLNKNADNKTKTQNIKKFINFYKKNKNDEGKLTQFYVKLSQQMQENPGDLQIWIEYEYTKSRIESSQTAISKEVFKFLTIVNNMKLQYDAPDFAEISAQYSKTTIINKISELLQCAKDEE